MNEFVSIEGMPTWAKLNKSEVTDWIVKVLENSGFGLGELFFKFVSDSELLDYNRRFRQGDYYTDVLTFDESVGMKLFGTVIISHQRVWENAHEYDEDPNREILRVMIHGVLHLMGVKDNEKEANTMRQKEEQALELFDVSRETIESKG